MKDFNKNTEFVCTAMDNCLLHIMYSDEVIKDYFIDENGNDVLFCGKNMRELFEGAIDCERMHANDLQNLQIYMNTINLRTKEDYIMDFFETYELNEDNDTRCNITERAFFQTLGHDYDEVLKLHDDVYAQLCFDIAANLGKYAAKKYGGEWDYNWGEGLFYTWNK